MHQKIQSILTKFLTQEDLKNQATTYFSSSLLNLDKLLIKKENNTLNPLTIIELDHLVDKEINKVLDAYIQIPIDIRNGVIKDDKTGKQLLLEQLTVLKNKIESMFNESIDKQKILVMHKKLTRDSIESELDSHIDPEIFQNSEHSQEEAKKFISSYYNEQAIFKKNKDVINEKKGFSPSHFLIIIFIFITILLVIYL